MPDDIVGSVLTQRKGPICKRPQRKLGQRDKTTLNGSDALLFFLALILRGIRMNVRRLTRL